MHVDLKSEIFAGISFRKVSGFCYKQNSYYGGNAPHITLKIQMFKQRHFSQFLRVVAFENSPAKKNMFKVDDTTATSVNVIWVSFDWLIKSGPQQH